MMETDADRLVAIKAVGGVLVRPRNIWAIFDREFIEVSDVETRSPAFACRSSDIHGAIKDDPIDVCGESFRIKRIEPDTPAPGWATVILKR